MPASTWTEPPRDWTDTELVNESTMDAHVKNQFKATPHLIAYKFADETVTSSTVLQNDDDLVFAVAANELWYVKVALLVVDATAGTADFKCAFTIPASTVMSISGADPVAGVWNHLEWTVSGTSQALNGVVSPGRFYELNGLVAVAGTAGNFQLQWAQNTSNGTGTVLRKGSAIYGLKLA